MSDERFLCQYRHSRRNFSFGQINEHEMTGLCYTTRFFPLLQPTLMQPTLMPPTYACSSSNALCSARTASSMYFSSISTEILISDVEIIWMLMPSSDSVRNIVLAMPTCERMPTPTTETFDTFGSPSTCSACT